MVASSTCLVHFSPPPPAATSLLLSSLPSVRGKVVLVAAGASMAVASRLHYQERSTVGRERGGAEMVEGRWRRRRPWWPDGSTPAEGLEAEEDILYEIERFRATVSECHGAAAWQAAGVALKITSTDWGAVLG